MTGLRKKLRSGGVLVLTALAMGIAHADNAPGLVGAFERAWARQAEAAGLPAREDEARAFADWAAGWTPGAPALSLGKVSDRFNRNDGKREWEIELGVPLWSSGEKAARVKEGDDALTALAARREALRLEVAGEVREAWWALAGARVVRDRALARQAAAVQLREDVERRFKAGDLARLDVNQAQSEVFDAEAELTDAEQTLVGAERHWLVLTGVPVPAQTPAEVPAKAVTAARLADHPQWQAARAASQLAASRLAAAQEKKRESPELAVRWTRDRGDFAQPYVNTVGVKLTIPFSSGPTWRRETAAARAETAQSEAELAQAEQGLRAGFEQARRSLVLVERQLAAASAQRRLGADSKALAEKAFALGEADLATLLRLRESARAAELRFLQLQIARDAAQSQLKQALGELP